MSRFALQLLPEAYIPLYRQKQPLTLHKHIARLRRVEPSLDYFSFLVASSVFSSRIEGNPIDLNDYYRYEEMGLKKTRPMQEIDDLIRAYEWARNGPLTEKRLLTAHKILSKTALSDNKRYQGVYRDKDVSVRNLTSGQVVYRGVSPARLSAELDKLLSDIDTLTNADLNHTEVFYFASMIHLCFAKIHPFADGNGRMARLLEKWFLSERLGAVAWYIPSERNYQRRLSAYYRHIDIGPDYDHLDYDHCLPFLLMLPWSLRLKTT